MRSDDPHCYLQTEARIIAEDETYAVVAVRIEKAAIARNLGLLGALAELAGRVVTASLERSR